MKRSILLLSITGATVLQAQDLKEDSLQLLKEEIYLKEVSITEKLPITVEKISNKELQAKNLGQDIPTLLSNSTSVLVSSDAGGGIGHSSIRIRGLSETSINVTLNGIPLNDAESQGVFWVNLPDLASSTNSILIQRGVGSSSNGMAAFGASVNIEMQQPSLKPYMQADVSFGSFNTQKYTLQAGTGKILNNKLTIDGRFSKLNSDGYRERAFSDLLSYDFTANYQLNDKTKFKFQNFYGNQKTYQAWNGIDAEMLKSNRRFNPSGAIKENNQIIGYYDNQTDNYQQNHYHLTWLQDYNKDWKSSLTFHYTKGKGYYEDYKDNAKLISYKIDYLPYTTKDLVRQKWLNNDFYGFNFEVSNQKLNNFKVWFGVAANEYDGDHYGFVKSIKDVIWTNTDFKYYNNRSVKQQISTYAKLLYQLNKLEIFGDLQYRYVNYSGKYLPNGENPYDDFRPFSAKNNFVNPKLGLNFKIDAYNSLYASYAISHREPLRSDYQNIANVPKAEYLQDYEFGYKKYGRFALSTNFYYMDYKNQLVPTGKTNDVGTPIRENSASSYRMGIELDASYQIIPNYLNIHGNITLSQNKNRNYMEADGKGNTDIALSPNVISAFGIDINPLKNIYIGWTNKYVGKQYLANTEPKDGQLPDYLIADVLIKYTPNWIKDNRLNFSLLINNVFDKKYVSGGYYFGEASYFPQAGINILGGLSIRL